MAKSDTVFFNINLLTPTPNPTLAPSPTQQPTTEPTQVTHSHTVPISDWIPYAILVIAVALGVSALVYFKKRKR
jgi:hypothetical protein